MSRDMLEKNTNPHKNLIVKTFKIITLFIVRVVVLVKYNPMRSILPIRGTTVNRIL
jgi:hypothetical protein